MNKRRLPENKWIVGTGCSFLSIHKRLQYKQRIASRNVPVQNLIVNTGIDIMPRIRASFVKDPLHHRILNSEFRVDIFILMKQISLVITCWAVGSPANLTWRCSKQVSNRVQVVGWDFHWTIRLDKEQRTNRLTRNEWTSGRNCPVTRTNCSKSVSDGTNDCHGKVSSAWWTTCK